MYTLRALLSYITSSTAAAAAGPFPWLRSRRSLFYGLLIVSYPQLKALSVHDVCAYTYIHTYVMNWSRKCILYLYVLQRAAIIIYIGTRGDHNIIIITVVVVVDVVAVYLCSISSIFTG